MGNDRDWKNRYNRRLLALTLFGSVVTALHIFVYFHYFYPISPTGWKRVLLSFLFNFPLSVTVLFFSLWLSCRITGGVPQHKGPITKENYRIRYTESAWVMGWAAVIALACWPVAFIGRFLPTFRQTYLHNNFDFLLLPVILWLTLWQGYHASLSQYEQKMAKQNEHGAGPEQA